jgi:hypothetical protein
MDEGNNCRRCGSNEIIEKYPYCRECMTLLRRYLADVDYQANVLERQGMDNYCGYSAESDRA